jgi:hypothetical protein
MARSIAQETPTGSRSLCDADTVSAANPDARRPQGPVLGCVPESDIRPQGMQGNRK